ncbi:MAG TPA: hypothetical protein VKD90_08880 [Gemmataceae bacterium]|nr:hypothetical protein [Gemmataceae bacterium]
MRQVIGWTVPLIAGVILAASGVAAGADPVKAAVGWSGAVADPALEAKKPADGLVGNGKDFAALWKAWRPNEEVPDVDFGSYFVLVVTRPKGHTFVIHLLPVGGGDVKVLSGTPVGGKELPGFGYGLAVFPRDKVKSIGGKEIPAK